MAVAVLLASCSSSGSNSSSGGGSGGKDGVTDNSISVGISVALTGIGASGCSPLNDALNAWFNHVNATGGVNGRKIKTIVRDDAYTAAQASVNAKTFVSDHVATVMGACGTAIAPALYPPLNAAKIPFLFPQAALQSMVDPVQPYSYALLPLYGNQLAALIKYAFDKYGPGSVAMVNDTVPGLDQTVSLTQAAVKKYGGTVGTTLTIPTGTADLTPYALKVAAAKPDYVILDMLSPDASRMTQLWTAQNFLPGKVYLSPSMLTQAQFLSSAGTSVNGRMISTSITAPPGSPEAAACSAVLTAAKIPVQSYTLWGCGVAQIFQKAVQDEGKNVSPANLVKTFDSWTNVTASSVFPPITFTAKNHMGVTKMYLVGIKDNKNYLLPTSEISIG